MSTATLNIWVTERGDACRIDNTSQWYIHILHCDGRLLRWCGRTYVNIRARCGHREIEVPPGCYMVVATWSPAPNSGPFPTFLGNHLTHVGVVRADCGDHECVTLFNPSFHFCSVWWLIAARQHRDMGLLPEEETEAALEAVRRLLENVQADPMTRRLVRELEANPVPEEDGDDDEDDRDD